VTTHAAEVTGVPVDIRVAKGNFALLSAMALETNLVAHTVARLFVAVGAIRLIGGRVNGRAIGFCAGMTTKASKLSNWDVRQRFKSTVRSRIPCCLAPARPVQTCGERLFWWNRRSNGWTRFPTATASRKDKQRSKQSHAGRRANHFQPTHFHHLRLKG
jgi:hypothetical protein